MLSTVSPSYARDVRTSEFGCGLDGPLAARGDDLRGILNGVDVDEWDPARDGYLPAHFDATDLSGKAACKAALQREMGLPVRADVPLFPPDLQTPRARRPAREDAAVPDVVRDGETPAAVTVGNAAASPAPDARAAHPREEHLLPLMVIAGAAGGDRGRVAFHDTFAGFHITAAHFEPALLADAAPEREDVGEARSGCHGGIIAGPGARAGLGPPARR